MTDRYPIPEFLRQPVEAPRERPIIFSASMIKAILAGTKTQTRRALKQQPIEGGPIGGFAFVDGFWCALSGFDGSIINRLDRPCPYGKPGDRLYVRENAWQRPERTQKMMREGADTWPPFIYDADYASEVSRANDAADLKAWGWKRRPSIHLPRIVSRILLEIVSVRVERLQDISEADAEAEGCEPFRRPTHPSIGPFAAGYSALWDSINGPGSWAANPWVWCLTFKRVPP